MEEEIMPVQRPKSFVPDDKEEQDISPPKSFIADEQEEHKPGIFSKIKEALTPAEKIHPGEEPKAKLDRFLGSVIDNKDSNIGRMIRSENPASEPILPPIKKEPETFTGGFIKGLYDEFVRPLSSAEGIAGIIGMGKGSPFHQSAVGKIKDLSIRQPSREIPYKVSGDLPSSIPEQFSDLKQPNVKQSISNFIEKNPEAKMKDVEKFIDSVKESKSSEILPPEFAAKGEEDLFNKVRTQRAKRALIEEESRYTAEDLAKADVEAKRLLESNSSGKREKFVNPFEKKVDEWGHKEGDLLGSSSQPGDFQKLENIEKTKNPDDISDLLPVAEKHLNELKQSYGVDSEEYGQALQELEDITRSSNAKSVGRGTGLKPQLAEAPKSFVADEAPIVPINKKLPRVSPENEADLELWFKYKKLHETGKMTDQQMTEWAKIHNEVKDLKGSATLRPHRFETLSEEPPEFTNYILPDGQKVRLSTSATKGAEKTTYQLKGGKVVEAIRDDSPDDIIDMSGGLGGIKPSSRPLQPNSGPYGKALDKLFESMGKMSENRVQQDIINKTERARRFASSAGVKEEGVVGAAKSLSALKGEFPKVDVEKLQMTQPQVDSLFTAVKRARISEGEKARGYTALFKLFNGEGVPQRNELRILDDVFGNDFASKVVEMHGGLGAVGLKLSKVSNTMKAMMASVDLSFPLRQGIGMIHKAEWRSAAVEQLKYFAKPEYYKAAMEAIETRPKFMLGRESGLFLAKHGSLESGEELFAHNYLGSLPDTLRMPFDASERAYTGGLNKLRSDLFDNLTDFAEKAGNEVFATKSVKNAAGELVETKVPTKVAENIAKYINVFTGRGGLGRLEPIANELNTVFWSPRLMTSRLTALNPKFYYDLDKFTRKEAIKSLFAIATASTIMNGLGAAAGAKIGYNILSSDFAKSRFSPSNNVLDPSGGFQQPIVAAARMIEELNRMRTGGRKEFNKPGIPGIAGNFLTNKLSPLTGLAYDIASAKQFSDKPGHETMFGNSNAGGYDDRFGNKKNILNEAGKRFVPMFIQDVYEIIDSDPSFAETIGLLPLTALGAGEQNYPEKTEKKKFMFRKPTSLR